MATKTNENKVKWVADTLLSKLGREISLTECVKCHYYVEGCTYEENLDKAQLICPQDIAFCNSLARTIITKTDKQVISGYHRPVCMKCKCELRPEKNGIGVLDMVSDETLGPQPYKLYDADLWKCPSCGMEVIGGFGQGPISAHYIEGFERMIERYEKISNLVRNTG